MILWNDREEVISISMSKCTSPNHFENLIIFGVCGKCQREWALGTETDEVEEGLKMTV